MKGIAPLLLGIFGTFAFSWIGLALIPSFQIGHLDPQMDEDGNDAYPAPKSGMADRGRRIYAANGCVYCHSQQVRADYAASDIDRKWGERRSAPRDYLFERPVLLGQMRMGPDLANIGKRAPVEDENAPAPGASAPSANAGAPPANASASPAIASSSPATVSASPAKTTASPATVSAPPANASTPANASATSANASGSPTNASAAKASSPAASPAPIASASPSSASATAATTSDATAPANGAPLPYSAAWHHLHLYSPRSVTLDSNMPAYHFLYETKRISGERAADALRLTGTDVAPEGWEIVPTYEAKCLVAYLMSLDQSHALKEVKASAPPSPPAPGKEAK